MDMHYAGERFPLHSSVQLADLEGLARRPKPQVVTIRLEGVDAYGRFLLGGNVPVAFLGLGGNDLPQPRESQMQVF